MRNEYRDPETLTHEELDPNNEFPELSDELKRGFLGMVYRRTQFTDEDWETASAHVRNYLAGAIKS